MMIGGMRADSEQRPMSIHNRQNYDATAAFGKGNGIPTARDRGKRAVDETLLLINCAFLAQPPFVLTPPLKSTMPCIVVGIAQGQHVPLHIRGQNPEHFLQRVAGGPGVAPRSAVGMCTWRKRARIRSHWSSRNRSMPTHYRELFDRQSLLN